jgi:rieske iron-sulfur protein
MGGDRRTFHCLARSAERRGVLKAALGLGLAAPFANFAVAQDKDPKNLPPQPGDRLVFFAGDRDGEVIAADDLTVGAPPVQAFPMDPASEVVRDGSALNQVLLVRLDPEELSQKTQANAADGVVAYSAICTHEACPVTAWDEKRNRLYCNCHGSAFDPADAAKVVMGPATRRLPMLPIKVEEGVLVVAGEFTGRVGAQRG